MEPNKKQKFAKIVAEQILADVCDNMADLRNLFNSMDEAAPGTDATDAACILKRNQEMEQTIKSRWQEVVMRAYNEVV